MVMVNLNLFALALLFLLGFAASVVADTGAGEWLALELVSILPRYEAAKARELGMAALAILLTLIIAYAIYFVLPPYIPR